MNLDTTLFLLSSIKGFLTFYDNKVKIEMLSGSHPHEDSLHIKVIFLS